MAALENPRSDEATETSTVSAQPSDQDPVNPDAPVWAGERASKERPRGLICRLARRLPRLFVLWLIMASPIAYAFHALMEPTYEASSILRVNLDVPQLFGDALEGNVDGNLDRQLESQVNFIRSAKITRMAIASPVVKSSNFVTESQQKGSDPMADLQRLLEVENIPKSNFIRVSLSVPNPREAADLVNAVVQAYQQTSQNFTRSTHQVLKKNLQDYLSEKWKEINEKISKLEVIDMMSAQFRKMELNPSDGVAGNNQAIHSSFKDVTVEQYGRLADRLFQLDIDLAEKASQLQVRAARSRGPSAKEGSPEFKALETTEVEVETLRKSRESLTQLLKNLNVKEEHKSHTVEASFLQAEIKRLIDLSDPVGRKLEQLKFETEREFTPIEVVDAATPAKEPSDNSQHKLMLGVPLGILIGLLCHALISEVRAGRHRP